MPFVSEAQRRLMYAAAAGKATKADISQKAAKKMVSEDEPGKLPEKVSKAEGDGSDMAKQLLAQINEMSAKLNQIIDSGEELEDWVDSKIVSAKKDLEDISGYLMHNEDTQKSMKKSENEPKIWLNHAFSLEKMPNLSQVSYESGGVEVLHPSNEHSWHILDNAISPKKVAGSMDLYHDKKSKKTIIHHSHINDHDYDEDQEHRAQHLPEIQKMAHEALENHYGGLDYQLDEDSFVPLIRQHANAAQQDEARDSDIPEKDNRSLLTEAKKSIHGSDNTPDRTVAIVDKISKADDLGDYEKKAQGALDFRNQMKQFRSQHGSTIMDIAGGRKISGEKADAYHAARGNLMIGQGVSHADIPPKIPGHLIDRSPKQPEIPALPAAKSMEALANPKSLVKGKSHGQFQQMADTNQVVSNFSKEDLTDLLHRHGAKALGLADDYDHAKDQLSQHYGDDPEHPEVIDQMVHNFRHDLPTETTDFGRPFLKLKPKSLLQKMDDCTKCMRKSSEEELEKSSKKSKPFHGYNKKKHARSGGLNDSYRKKVNRETGSNLKRPVTKKNVKPGSKAAKRRKSFCARMSGVKGPTSKKGKLTPKGAALKRWRCSKSLNKSESVPLEARADKVLKSLKSKLLAGAAAIGGLASGAAMASPESDLHSQLSNLNAMGEYHTPKSGSQAVLKEPSQLKADPSHPAASYSRESGGGSSMGSFHGPDAEKAKQLLQNYDAVNKCFKKSNEIKPFGQNIYDANANLGRKMGRTGEEVESAGRNKAVQQYGSTAWGSSKEQSERSAKEAKAKSKKNPVMMLDLSEVPSEERQNVISAYQSKQSHPLLDRAVKVLNTKKQKTEKSETDKLVGGKGDLKNVSDFDPLEVDKGKKVEEEHTKDPSVAQEITKDHLSEDPKYYSRLKSAGLADELNKAYEVLSKLEKRCWKGYKPVPGKKAYSKGSCEPVGKSQDQTQISAPAMESGKYQGEKLDAHHHNRLGREYKQLAMNAHKSGDKAKASSYLDKASYHFSMADKKGYEPPNE